MRKKTDDALIKVSNSALVSAFMTEMEADSPVTQGNNLHGLGDSVSLGRFASESLAWEKWSNFPHNRYVEEAKNYAQPGSVAEKKAFFEAYLKMELGIDAAAQSSAISLAQPLTEKIVVATNRKNKATLNNTEKFEDHSSVSEDSGTSQMDPPLLKSKLSTDQEVLQPKISRKPATSSFRSSSYGRKQSRIPLSPANYASMHPGKENMLTPITQNKLQSPTIPSPFTLRTEERAARRK
ncbi:hypothetical protein Tco_0558784 [Tanacetum coccineum]